MNLNAALRHSMYRAPYSIRALARKAGVSNQILSAIMTGRERATPRVALKVAQALEQWAKWCGTEAARIRAAVERYHKGR